jgi:hypothetical protein
MTGRTITARRRSNRQKKDKRLLVDLHDHAGAYSADAGPMMAKSARLSTTYVTVGPPAFG